MRFALFMRGGSKYYRDCQRSLPLWVKALENHKSRNKMVRPERVELPTYWFVAFYLVSNADTKQKNLCLLPLFTLTYRHG